MKINIKINIVFLACGIIIFGYSYGQDFATVRSKALAGDPEAMVKLAEAFEMGKGTAPSEDSSRFWMKKSAEMKHPPGMFAWGSYLVTKIYSEKEFAEGIKWLRRAADTSQVNALIKLYELQVQKNTATEVDKFYNLARAFECIRKADSLGSPKATLTTAECYLKGQGTARNDSMAAVLFRKSAEVHNVARGQIRLADMYLEGKVNGKPDLWQAWNWYKSAYEHSAGSLDDRGLADVGMHKIDQMLKQSQNLMLQSAPFLPAGTFNYRLQKSE